VLSLALDARKPKVITKAACERTVELVLDWTAYERVGWDEKFFSPEWTIFGHILCPLY
jgi:hypothetical protein